MRRIIRNRSRRNKPNRMKKTATILQIAIGLFLIVSIAYLYFNQKNVAFFDYNTVYNNCKLKLKLEKDLIRVGNLRKGELDSLQMELSFLSARIGNNKASQDELDQFEDMKNRFLTYKEKYEQENIQLKETYFSQIRKEINDKARIYSEKRGYDYLFALVGDGSLIYGAESEDITEEFQQFVDKE